MLKVCAKRCDECLFSSSKIVSDKRKEEIIADCTAHDTFFNCHKAKLRELGGAAKEEQVCRGWYDEMRGVGQLIRIAGRMGVLVFVDPTRGDVLYKQGEKPR